MARFPHVSFIGLGAAQIIIGNILLVLNISNACLAIAMAVGCEYGCERVDELHFLIFTVPVIFTSILFIIAGGLGIGAGKSRAPHRQSGLKHGCMVMSILSALGALEVIFLGLGEIGYVGGHDMDYFMPLVIMAVVSMILGFIEFLIAVVTASVACCCSPVYDQYMQIHPTL